MKLKDLELKHGILSKKENMFGGGGSFLKDLYNNKNDRSPKSKSSEGNSGMTYVYRRKMNQSHSLRKTDDLEILLLRKELYGNDFTNYYLLIEVEVQKRKASSTVKSIKLEHVDKGK